MKAYRSPKIEVRDDTFAGRGVVAIANIDKDEIVAIKAGHILRGDEVRRVTVEVGDYALQIDDDFYLSPRTAQEVDDMTVFINHSCDANVGFRGQVVYVALRNIKKGEELCHDYSMVRSDGYELDCRCGSPLCRGTITGKDWQLPELQQRYGEYFSIYLLNKIRHPSSP